MKVIHIGILDFTPDGFPEELYLDYYFVNKKGGHVYSDKLTILMLQLNQLGNAEDEANMPDLYHWAQLFRATTWKEIVMLAEKNESIKDCLVTLKELSEDEKIQLECEARERNRLDFAAATRYGYKHGREEERVVGINKMVASLRKLNVKDENIIATLVEQYRLSESQAEGYLKKTDI